MPKVQVVDLKYAQKHKTMHGHFSGELTEALDHALKHGKQAILFQNRRGFSTFIQCQGCGEAVQCKHCDISMTYHKLPNLLKCHYCGYTRKVPKHCPTCGSNQLHALGFGTEKLEDDLQILLPHAKIQRMDLDTTRKKNAYQNIITSFEQGETDILIGTQMVTKGLDFDNVALVGIINADALIHFPDFRSHERAFQLMAQVAGRAGRKNFPGKVMVQTSLPQHNVVKKVTDHDYKGFYTSEIHERKSFQYPPFVRLIHIEMRHRDRNILIKKTDLLAVRLKKIFGARILGPEFPLVPRLKNRYIMEFLLKLEQGVSLAKAKTMLLQTQDAFELEFPENRVEIIYNVDPY